MFINKILNQFQPRRTAESKRVLDSSEKGGGASPMLKNLLKATTSNNQGRNFLIQCAWNHTEYFLSSNSAICTLFVQFYLLFFQNSAGTVLAAPTTAFPPGLLAANPGLANAVPGSLVVVASPSISSSGRHLNVDIRN